MQLAAEYFNKLWRVLLEAAPWLLFGLLIAGAIKVWLPTRLLQRWLGGRGFLPIINAAVLGTPLPLCSCSFVPAPTIKPVPIDITPSRESESFL